MTKGSDFGRGLVICLVKFSEHFMYLYYNWDVRVKHQIEFDKMFYKKYKEYSPPKDYNKYAISNIITNWANGASDHLYEIEVPKGRQWSKIRKKVEELQDKGLDMGHGAGFMNVKEYTRKDVDYLMELTREIALDVDKIIGLEPEMGDY